MIIGKIILLQILVAAVIVWVLWGVLKRELIQAALQDLEQLDSRRETTDVSVLISAVLSSLDDKRLRLALNKKFPKARVNVSLNSEIWGGMVICAGDHLIDHSLLTRVKHFFGKDEGV